jgi:cell division protein FtsB
VTRGRWLALVVVVLAAGFALLGGEYSIFDLRKLREDARIETDSVAVLTAMVDSLTRELEAILTDPAVQERIAREQWGMLREGEFGYRIQRNAPDSRPP